ncbi:Polysaccharide monooxygenase Cel61a [Madurella mycetomatis]|uniref:lytic cellulose monooxygenase (C4-dehydrogenating) n=1 Tax=Madurella mycetomatis TaxID=100816 RepID=A0A175VYG0_9PEZI|nr:Polysaccharide monooxygenase Cel61a [Madurella mycetomatis]
MSKTSAVLASLAGAALVAAHGHVSHIIVNGVYYENYDPTTHSYQPNPPTVIGWSADQQDNGFVEPNNFGTSDIICHKAGAPGGGHATVNAGDKISIVWTPEWPESHIGPVIDYLAACNGDCETVNKESLRWFKIDGAGYNSDTGTWAADDLRANGNSWLVQIPSDLSDGNYVLRHEIIALHGASSPNGAQAYPQCINLRVTGGGSNSPSGVAGTSLYSANDPGILFNPYSGSVNYPVPGPALIAGAVSSIAQSQSAATRTASATAPGGGGGNPEPTNPAPTTTRGAVTTTLQTVTQAPEPTTPPAGGAEQTRWGQCGGSGWVSPTACVAGSSCSVINAYYHQCV